MVTVRAILAGVTILALAGASPPTHGRPWTLDDVLAIPELGDLAISEDGQWVASIVRLPDEASNRPLYALHLTAAEDGRDRVLLEAPWLGRLRTVPGATGWTVLADLGEGVQLYRVDSAGTVELLVRSASTVLAGFAEGADPDFLETGPIRVGVNFYDWSPDGARLFYSTLETIPAAPRIVSGEQVNAVSTQRRTRPAVRVNFFLRSSHGTVTPVVSRPGSDRVARYLGALPSWEDGAIEFGVQAEDRPEPVVERRRWDFATRRAVPTAQGASPRQSVTGPRGGVLAVTRTEGGRRLVERLPDGTEADYGAVDVSLSDPRSPGSWRAPDGAFTMAAVHLDGEDRYGLMRIGRDRTLRLVAVRESLTHCSFTSDARLGACIHEGLSVPPRIVLVDARGGARPLRAISPRHEAITPLVVERRRWQNSFGYAASGFVVFPRGFRRGARYPAIFVTHGIDADQRFGARDLQWNYPVQLWAERGYVVVLVNDPSLRPYPALEAAYTALNSCDGRMEPAELRRLIWLNAVEVYRSAVAALAGEGLIDPQRVGIAGYSSGSQMVNVAVTQTDLFRAASSGDGAFLEPAAWRYNRCGYDAIYGGAPGEREASANYFAFAPTYRADQTRTAVLQQLAEPRVGAIEFYLALQRAGVPAAMTLYPGEDAHSDETHMFHIPSNRRAAAEENLRWFDSWLGGGMDVLRHGGARAAQTKPAPQQPQ